MSKSVTDKIIQRALKNWEEASLVYHKYWTKVMTKRRLRQKTIEQSTLCEDSIS